MSRNVWPDGKPGRDAGDLDRRALERVLGLGDERRVDADRGDGRDRRVARLRAHRLDAQRPDLARRVLPLERGQVHHRDREVERPQLRRLLDRAPLERIDPLLDADLVDRGDPPEQAAERPGTAVPGTDQLVGALAGECVGASRGGHGTERIHLGPERGQTGAAGLASARRGPWAAAAGRACRRPGSGGTRLDDAQVLDAPERRPGAGQLVGLLGDAQQADRPAERAQDREQRLGLGDRRPQVALRVLDQQRRPDRRRRRRSARSRGSRRGPPTAWSRTRAGPVAAADVAGQEQHAHVADRAAGHRRPEALVVADDPVREVAAVRAAGDAQAVRVGQAVGDERVDAGQDVARRARSPVAVVGVVERLAVALRAARVAVEDADPGGRQDLELPRRRPAVEGVRAAVDLDDERSRAVAGRGSASPGCRGRRPSTWRSTGSRSSSSSRTSALKAVRRRGFDGRLAAAPRAATGRAARSASSAGRRSAHATADPCGTGVPARDVVAPLGQPLEPAIGDGDPPQLVGAVDRGAEGEPAAVLRRDQPRALAARHVAAHPGAGHQVVRAPTGSGRRSASRPTRRRRTARCRCGSRLRPRAGARAPRSCAPSGSHVGAKNIERGPRVTAVTARGLDVDDVDVQPAREEVGVASPVRREGDASSVGRPGRLAVRGPAIGQARWPRRSRRPPARGG